MKLNKKDLSVGMETYVVFLVYNKNTRAYEYETKECHITKIGRKRLTVDFVQSNFQEFLIDSESCNRLEFAIPAAHYDPSSRTVLCLTESDAKKTYLKTEINERVFETDIFRKHLSIKTTFVNESWT